MDFKGQIDAWANYTKTRCSQGTARLYRIHLQRFFEWLAERPLTQEAIEDHVTDCLSNKLAKTTVNSKIAAIKSFCKWYCPRRQIPDPSAGMKLFPANEAKPEKQRFLTPEEYAKVLAVAEPGIGRDTLEFLANTGLRRAEYCALALGDIDVKGTHLTVQHGKGNKKRHVPMNTKVKDIIARNTSREKTLLCVTYWQGRGNAIWAWCQSLARRARIPAFGPHALRHLFATRLIKNGVPIKMVSQILGHSTVLMTEKVYCHILPEDTTGVTECLFNYRSLRKELKVITPRMGAWTDRYRYRMAGESGDGCERSNWPSRAGTNGPLPKSWESARPR